MRYIFLKVHHCKLGHKDQVAVSGGDDENDGDGGW